MTRTAHLRQRAGVLLALLGLLVSLLAVVAPPAALATVACSGVNIGNFELKRLVLELDDGDAYLDTDVDSWCYDNNDIRFDGVTSELKDGFVPGDGDEDDGNIHISCSRDLTNLVVTFEGQTYAVTDFWIDSRNRSSNNDTGNRGDCQPADTFPDFDPDTPEPDIEVKKLVDADRDGSFDDDTDEAAAEDDTADFQVTVENTGNVAAPVRLIDAFDSTTLNLFGTFDAGAVTEATCSLQSDPLTSFEIDDELGVDEVIVCLFSVDDYAPAAGDSLTNTITAQLYDYAAAAGDEVLAFATDDATVTTPAAVPEPDIEVKKLVDADRDGSFDDDTDEAAAEDDTVDFQVTVENTGNVAAPVRLIDAFDSTTLNLFGTFDAGAVTEATCSLQSDPLTSFEIDDELGVDEVIVCLFSVDDYAPAAGDSLTNTITAQLYDYAAAAGDEVLAFATDDATVTTPAAITDPAITVVKTNDADPNESNGDDPYTDRETVGEGAVPFRTVVENTGDVTGKLALFDLVPFTADETCEGQGDEGCSELRIFGQGSLSDSESPLTQCLRIPESFDGPLTVPALQAVEAPTFSTMDDFAPGERLACFFELDGADVDLAGEGYGDDLEPGEERTNDVIAALVKYDEGESDDLRPVSFSTAAVVPADEVFVPGATVLGAATDPSTVFRAPAVGGPTTPQAPQPDPTPAESSAFGDCESASIVGVIGDGGNGTLEVNVDGAIATREVIDGRGELGGLTLGESYPVVVRDANDVVIFDGPVTVPDDCTVVLDEPPLVQDPPPLTVDPPEEPTVVEDVVIENPAPEPPAPQLARTGLGTGEGLALGLGMMLFGIALVFNERRRTGF